MEAREVAGRGVAPVPDAWRNDKQVLILRKYFINQMIGVAGPHRARNGGMAVTPGGLVAPVSASS